MRTSPEINELMPDLIKAQLVLKNPTKTESAQAGTRTYQYFDLAGLREHSATILAQHNLCIVQTTEFDEAGNFFLRTRLYHKSGQWIEGDFPLPTGVKSQDIGAAMTYARRYSWAAMIGLHGDKDTDGKEGTVPALSKAFSRQTMDPLSDRDEDKRTPTPYASKAPYEHLLEQMKKCKDVEEMALWWQDVTPMRNNQLNGAWHMRLFITYAQHACDIAMNQSELIKFWGLHKTALEALKNRDAGEYAELDKLYTMTVNGFNTQSG